MQGFCVRCGLASLEGLLIVGSLRWYSRSLAHESPWRLRESPVDRGEPSSTPPTSTTRPRDPISSRSFRERASRGQEPERARAETTDGCVFRRNMGLFPFATRFARASQLAFVARVRRPTQFIPLFLPRIPHPTSPLGSLCAHPPFSSGVCAVIRTVVFARVRLA